jgi:competence CoiA-like predicted nuclease
MDKVDVFISSVMNELEYDREIVCEMINSISLNSAMFEMFPSMAESPTEAYLEKVLNCNIFILILWKSFTDAVYNEYNEAIRKNKPVLIFLKNLKDGEKRSLELISFIKNIESATIKATIYKQYRTIEQLRQEVKKAISNEIAKNYEIPRLSQTREDLYELGGSIINQSYNRVFIFEKTPCLFLGSRDYLSSDDKKVSYEAKVVSILSEWIEKNKNKNYTEFLSLFSIEKTKAELSPLRNNKEYLDKVKARILMYKQYE